MKKLVFCALLTICCMAVLTPAANADLLYTSNQGLCCFTVNLHQGSGEVDITVTAISPATNFANTGSPYPTNHPGFAFNLDTTITVANITTATSPSGALHFNVGPDPTNGPNFGTFGYYFDMPNSGSNNASPLTIVISGVTVSDFVANGSGYFFAADLLANGLTAESGINTPPTTVPEPSSMMLLGTGLAGLAGLVRRKFRS